MTLPLDQQNVPSPIPDLSTSLRAAFQEPGAVDTSSPQPNLPALDTDEGSEPEPQPNVDTAPPEPVKDDKSVEPKPADKKAPTPQGTPKGGIPANAQDPNEPKDPDTFEMPKNMPASQQVGWKQFKANAKITHDALKKTREELKQVKTALAERPSIKPQELEALKKENEELKGIRSIVDIDSDPEYVKGYLEPLTQAESELTALLKSQGVDDATIASLDLKNSKVVSHVYKTLQEKVDLMVADQFKEGAQAYLKALVRQEKYLKDHKVKHKEFQANRLKEQEVKGTQAKAAIDAEIERLATSKAPDSEDHQFPFLATFKAREGAPQDEIEAIEKHNEYAQRMRGAVNNVLGILKDGSPQEHAQVAVAVLTANYLHGVTKTLQAENASLKAELAKFGKAEAVKPSGGDAPKNTVKGMAANAIDAESAIDKAFPGMK